MENQWLTLLLLLIAQSGASAPPRLSGEVATTDASAAVVDGERVDGAAAVLLASLEASLASPTPLPTYEDDAIVVAVADAAARGNTAWVIMAAALVLMMTVPGLSLLFGGLIDSGNVINTFLLTLTTMGAVTVQWAVCGYSLAFGRGAFGGCGFVGGVSHFLMTDVSTDLASWGDGAQTSVLGYFLFQMSFAVITPAVITGAVVGRMRLEAWVLFALVWTTFVYCPVCFWAWADDGWLNKVTDSPTPPPPLARSRLLSPPPSPPLRSLAQRRYELNQPACSLWCPSLVAEGETAHA